MNFVDITEAIKKYICCVDVVCYWLHFLKNNENR